MKKSVGILVLIVSLFWGLGSGLAMAEGTATNTVITTNETGTPIVTSSSQPPVVADPVVVNPQSPTTVKSTTPAMSVMPNSGTSPATDFALKSMENGSLTIEPIPIADFVNNIERKMFEIVMGIRQFSIPYAIFVLTIGGLVLMIPFKMPMQKMLGFGIIGFGLLGFLLIWFGPVILGLAKGLAQSS